MNRKQYTMFIKLLNETGKADFKGKTFEIKTNNNNISRLSLFDGGKLTTLFAGTYNECVNACSDFIEMSYNIVD